MSEYFYDEKSGGGPRPGISYVVQRSYPKHDEPGKTVRVGVVWNGEKWEDFVDVVTEPFKMKSPKGMR